MMEEQKFYGSILSVDTEQKAVKASILHWGKVNENSWRAMAGSLDAFLSRIKDAGKGVAGCYQHDTTKLIGVWKDFEISKEELIATLYFADTPFVNEVVLPQLKAGVLQGASPTIIPVEKFINKTEACIDVLEGLLEEISLVGLPADLRADILEMRAKIEKQKNGLTTDLFLLIN